MGGFNANYQPIDELGAVNQVGNSYNPMSGVNLNAGPSHKPASESPLILDPPPVIQQKQPMTAQSGMYTHTQTPKCLGIFGMLVHIAVGYYNSIIFQSLMHVSLIISECCYWLLRVFLV